MALQRPIYLQFFRFAMWHVLSSNNAHKMEEILCLTAYKVDCIYEVRICAVQKNIE